MPEASRLGGGEGDEDPPAVLASGRCKCLEAQGFGGTSLPHPLRAEQVVTRTGVKLVGVESDLVQGEKNEVQII